MNNIRSLLLIIFCVINHVAHADNALPPGVMDYGGKPAPELKLNDIDGEPYDLATHRGHWVFVHFWATWCGPCRKEMPTIPRMMSKLEDTQLHMALINTAENEDTVFPFLGIVAPELTPLMDTDGRVTERWQPRGLPASFLVDPDGNIQYLALGGREWDQPVYINFLRSLMHSSTGK